MITLERQQRVRRNLELFAADHPKKEHLLLAIDDLLEEIGYLENHKAGSNDLERLYLLTQEGFKRMDERFVAMDKRFETLQKQMDERFISMDKRFETLQKQMDERFISIDKRFETLQKQMDERFVAMDKRFETLQKQMDERFVAMDKRFETLQKQMDNRFTQLQWLIGVMFAALSLFIGWLGTRQPAIDETKLQKSLTEAVSKGFQDAVQELKLRTK